MPPPNAAYQQMPSHLPQGQVPPNNQQQQFHPGQLPQAQINPHNLPHAQVCIYNKFISRQRKI